MSVRMRQFVERTILRKLFEEGIKRGYSFGIECLEDVSYVVVSSDVDTLMDNIMQGDEDCIVLLSGEKRVGWVVAVYGNEGYNVISDYSCNEITDSIMKEVDKIADYWDSEGEYVQKFDEREM